MNLFQYNQPEFAWWVEINTTVPRCTYYFGPFDSEKEAQLSRSGYVEDLYQEGARDIIALVNQPDILTIFQDEAEAILSKLFEVLPKLDMYKIIV